MVSGDKIHEKSVFVRIDEYKEVIELFTQLKEKLGKAKETIAKVAELKSEEQVEIELWNNSLAEIEKKMAYIDQTLTETEGE